MYTPTFDYFRPTTVREAIDLLKSNPEAKLLAGGHSLLPAMKLRATAPAALVDLSRVPGLSGIELAGDRLTIGALTTHGAVVANATVSEHCPLLHETAMNIGDLQVRNRGTIGGSIAHADPAADYPTTLLALGAEITVEGPSGSRTIKAADFFLDLFSTALGEAEIVTAVSVPTYGSGTGGAYIKHRHPASSYAVVGAAALVTVSAGKVSSAALAIGGAQSHAVRASAAEAALVGQAPSTENLAAAAARVADAVTAPMSDLYASGEYRAHLAVVLAERALAQAVSRAG